jgi:anion-transporting  ArsA/GET3 family ATPase
VSGASSFGELVEQRRVLVCCGTGGVGKTTTAAVLGLEAARRGRRVVVVTIDPARRLASALGLHDLADEPSLIPRSAWGPSGDGDGGDGGGRSGGRSGGSGGGGRSGGSRGPDGPDGPDGELWALMLDPKSTFDRLVVRHAGTPEQGQRILANRLYRNISTVLSGTQEYMAMEQLHELHVDPRFDLVVVDTPPSRRALDFLDAPRRLARLLDNRFFRLLMAPTRLGFRAASNALSAFLRIIARVVGSDVVGDVSAFFRAFEGMEQGFRERSAAVAALLTSEEAAFVLVTSPRADAVEEAGYFADRLAGEGLAVGALIVNRLLPTFGSTEDHWRRRSAALARPSAGAGEARDAVDRRDAGALAVAFAVLADLEGAAAEERATIAPLLERVGAAPVAEVPALAREVADLASLAEVGDYVFGRRGSEH